MASQILRRIVDGAVPAEIIRRANAVIDMLNGNRPGRIKLHGDDGTEANPIGGASVSSGNYALDVKAASGLHGQFTHSTGSPIILAIADSGNVTASAINSGDVGVTGNLTFVGTARRIKADLSNATVANRLLIQSSTPNGDTRLALIPNGTSVITQFAALNSATTTAATGAVVAVTGTEVRFGSSDFGGGYLPVAFVNGGSIQAGISTAGVMHAAVSLVVGGTAMIGTEKLYVAGNALLSNASYLNGRNAGGTAVNLLRINASDIIESGQTGTRHNLLGTVVAPDIDPPTVNGQVTQRAVAAAWAYFTVSGGAVTLRDSYNVTSVTYNAAGNFTVAWDRDFASANYVCLPGVEDNGAAGLSAKVNSKIAGSADIHVFNAASTLTDPDAFVVACWGTLS